MSLDPYLLLAQERQRVLRSEAARQALIEIATCCRPSAWRRTVHGGRARYQQRALCCA